VYIFNVHCSGYRLKNIGRFSLLLKGDVLQGAPVFPSPWDSLRFYGVPCLGPGRKTTFNRCNFRKTHLLQDERRTGAALLSRSGAVSDDPIRRA
jgi:hypothetical protein